MTTYRDMPVANCGTNLSHMAHVYPVDGEKVVCRGLLPHSVPTSCTCPEVDVTMPAGWRCPVHGAADQP